MVATLLPAFLLGACSDGTPPVGPGAAESEPPQVAPSQDFVSGKECPPAERSELPARTGCVTTAEGDADGDGTMDRLFLYARLGDDAKPRSWHVKVMTSTSEYQDRVDAGHGTSYPRAVGAADVDGDGKDEWWIKIYDLASHGTDWQRTNAFVLQDDGFVPVTFDGEPLHMNVGGISRMGEGVACRDGQLILLRAEAKNVRNTRWRFSERRYSLHGAEARFEERTEGWLLLDHYNDPKLDPYYRIECLGISYPRF